MRTRASVLLAFILSIAGLAAAAAAVPAQAATAAPAAHAPNVAAIALAKKVLPAPHPEAAWRALDPAQKCEFGQATRPVSVTVKAVGVRGIAGAIPARD